MIDWESNENHVLLNPRMPDRMRVSQILEPLPAHIWVTTSGTTGRFKYVALSKQAFLISAEAVNKHLESDSNDVWLQNLPEFHVGGLGIYARAHLSGATIVKDLDEGVTLAAFVPTQIYDLVVNKVKAPSTLRATIVGGGALPRKLWDEANTLGYNILQSYGMTETATQIATATPGHFGSMKILDHMHLKVDGTLHIKSPSLFTRYAEIENNDVVYSEPIVDGWFKSEDFAEVDGDKLKVFGRTRDFVKISGESVNLNYLRGVLDEVLINYPFDAAITSIADDRLGSAIELVTEREDPSLIKEFNERVMPYERIRSVRLVSQLSRTETGKIKL